MHLDYCKCVVIGVYWFNFFLFIHIRAHINSNSNKSHEVRTQLLSMHVGLGKIKTLIIIPFKNIFKAVWKRALS